MAVGKEETNSHTDKNYTSVKFTSVTLSFSCRFLLEALEDLDTSLRKLNLRLFVVRGQPTDVFPRLFKVRKCQINDQIS